MRGVESELMEISNHPGYFADRLGNIYSSKTKGGGLRILKQSRRSKKSGHLRIMFGGDRKNYSVHRVIYEAFHGPIPNGLLICHKNDDPTDNRIENLYAGTQKENHADAIRNNKKANGERCGSSKLTENEVLEILSLKNKMRNTDIANAFDINKCTITDIFKNRTWKHIKRRNDFI